MRVLACEVCYLAVTFAVYMYLRSCESARTCVEPACFACFLGGRATLRYLWFEYLSTFHGMAGAESAGRGYFTDESSIDWPGGAAGGDGEGATSAQSVAIPNGSAALEYETCSQNIKSVRASDDISLKLFHLDAEN